jgi:hypothetical protein
VIAQRWGILTMVAGLGLLALVRERPRADVFAG